MRLLKFLAGVLIMLVMSSASWAADYYIVNDNGIKYSTTSFAHAKSSGTAELPTTFAAGDNLYFAKGTYTLTKTITINANINAKLYGGFSGDETTINLDARDIAGNQTILDGGNARGVIECKANATIDGFTIQNGKGSNQGDASGHSYRGGGMYIQNASPTIKNCTFKNNTAEQGGGIYIDAYNGSSSPQIINCLFANNSTQDFSSPATEGFLGAAILIAGDIANDSVNAQITNCTFISNSSNGYGGAVCVDNLNSSNISAVITACTFSGNTAGNQGSAVFVNNASVNINSCTLINNDIYNAGSTAVSAKNSIIGTASGTGTINKTTCFTLSSSPTSSTESINGVTHTVFKIEDNADILADCVYSGTADSSITTDQIGRTFHNPPSIGAVELSEDIAITTDSLAAGKINEAYTASITAEGTEPLTWDISGLPEGLSKNASTTKTLTITGTPTEAGSFTVKVNVSSFGGKVKADEKTFALTIEADKPAINTSSLPEGTINQSYTASITATGTEPLTWEISGLPKGLGHDDSATSTLTISGTPAEAGSFTVNISAANSAGSDDKSYSLVINDVIIPEDIPVVLTAPKIITESLPNALIGENYSAVINASGSTPLTWQISGLPDGIDYANSVGTNTLITGQAAQSGTYEITINLTNSVGTDSKVLTLKVNKGGSSSTEIMNNDLPVGFQGHQYNALLEASGSGESSWTASGLPEGLTLEGSTITGTPNVFGEFEITINVKNDSGSDSKTFTLKIYSLHQRSDRNAPEITSRAPSDGYYKRFYSHKFTARGKAPITWQVSGDVPPGLEIDTELGMFSGVPAQTGEFIFTVTAANNSGLRSQNVTLKILDVPASMILFEKICSDPFVIKISELKGSGLNFDKIFRDNYSLFRIHRSKEAGAAFIEFIGSLDDYTASLQLSNMTSLVTAEFKGFNNQDFSFNYPENQKANTSQIVNISDSDSDSKIPNNIIIGAVSEADANDIDSLVNTLDGSGLAKISRIEFISSDIKSLSGLEVFTGLKALCVNQCPNLESVTLTGCSTLESLIINNANITALDLTDCVNLTYLDVNECSKLAKLSGLNGNIKTLKAAYTSLAELDLTGKNKLAHLNLNESKLTKLDLTGCTGLEVLSLLNAKDLAELDLSQCPSLVDVYAGGTAIDKFASSSQNSLRKLDLSGCINLGEIDIAGYSLLEDLIITGIRITELDLGNCSSLVKVIANGCELLSAINLEGCDNLLELNINGTLFTELDLTGINTLTKLDAGSCTKLESLIINDCENLQELICSGCNLASLDLSHNNNLVMLDFRMNFVTNSRLNLDSKNNLEQLYCYGNSLAFLDLHNTNLTSADFMNQTIYGFTSAISLDIRKFTGSKSENISNVQAFNQSGDVIPCEYKEGVASFSQAPFAVSYEYATGYDNDNIKMDVLLTNAEIPETNSGYLDDSKCGNCNSGINLAGLGALLVFVFMRKKK